MMDAWQGNLNGRGRHTELLSAIEDPQHKLLWIIVHDTTWSHLVHTTAGFKWGSSHSPRYMLRVPGSDG